jgi:hypothetical protein
MVVNGSSSKSYGDVGLIGRKSVCSMDNANNNTNNNENSSSDSSGESDSGEESETEIIYASMRKLETRLLSLTTQRFRLMHPDIAFIAAKMDANIPLTTREILR